MQGNKGGGLLRAQSYPVGLAGERAYQDAIAGCEAGQPVLIFREPDNPHDPDAIVVLSLAMRRLGYIPRDSWLQGAVHDEGKGCVGTVKEIEGPPGRLGVVIDVMFVQMENGLPTWPYSEEAAADPSVTQRLRSQALPQGSSTSSVTPAVQADSVGSGGGSLNLLGLIAVIVAALLLLVSLAGCSSETEQLERQLKTMEDGGAKAADRCAQLRKIEDAYSRAGDSEKYQHARGRRAAYCAIARMNAEMGIAE
jgi:hypothetical protein